MRKILIGIIVLAVVVIGGYFGTAYWAQGQTEKNVEAAFDAMRASGMTAAHGPIKSDLLRRSVVIDDVVVQSNGSPLSIKASKVEVAGLSAPSAPIRKIDPSSPLDAVRATIENFASTNASSINIPSLTMSFRLPMPGTSSKPDQPLDFTYSISGMVLRDLHDHRIGSWSVDRIESTVPSLAGPGQPDLGKFTVEMTNVTNSDIDLDVILAMLDPAEAGKSGPYRHVQGRMTAGTYKGQFEKGGRFQIDSMSGDGWDVQPSKVNFAQLVSVVAMIEAAQKAGTPAPAQAQQMIELIGRLYDGIRIGQFEVRGVSVTVPPSGEVKFAALHFKGFENGRLGEFAIEDVDAPIPQQGQLKLGRFSLAGLNFGNIIRLVGQAASGRIGTDSLPLIEGITIDRLAVPVPQAREPVVIDNFDFSLGQYVGPVPTKASLKLKLSSPIIANGNAEAVKVLAAAGVTSVAVNFDVAAGWTDSSKTFAITPFALDIANWFSANAAVSVGNVPRDVFIIDPRYATKIAPLVMGIELGPFELTLRDTGGLDVLLGIFAKQQGISPADARNTLVLGLTGVAAGPILAGHPELKPVVEAATKFLETSKGTFSLKVVPNGKVTVAQVAAAAQANPADPLAALASFKIDAGNR